MGEYTKTQALAGDFTDIGRVHDWRNYLSDKVRALWPTFTDEQKIALYEQAKVLSDNEEWD